VSLHRESATFIDPRDAWKWEIDLTFLASAWTCIYGCGCKGIKGDPVNGCCADGVFIKAEKGDTEGAKDFKRVKKRVAELTADDWDLIDRYRDDWWKERTKGSKHTRVHAGNCVFQNTGGGSSGTVGCAFHVAAVRRGEDFLDWKPFVCGLVPFALDHDEETRTHTLRAYDHERDWGSGEGEPLDWWCIDAPEAYVAEQAVYRTEEHLLRRLLGDELYDEVAAHMEKRMGGERPSRTPINWQGHWGVEPADGTTATPRRLKKKDRAARAKP
jgi:hypothetical protein